MAAGQHHQQQYRRGVPCSHDYGRQGPNSGCNGYRKGHCDIRYVPTLDCKAPPRLTVAVNTNIVFWSLIFAISWVVLAGMLRIQEAALESVDVERQLVSLPWTPSLGRPPVLNIPEHLPAISMRLSSWRSSETTMVSGDTSARTTLAGTPAPQDLQSSVESLSYPRAYKKIKKSAETTTAKPTATCPELATGNYPVFLSLFFALAIGFPVAAKAGDDRILDGCVLWFVWASTVQFQRVFKTIALMNGFPKTKSVLVTLLNPVAWTTIGMIAYTRAKAGVVGDLDGVLAVFSSGTSLSDLWNAHVARIPLRRSQPDWFGAGDAALSVLESGIVAWGFKLFECRRELWSRAGAVVVLLSSLSAIMSVFVSVLLGRGVGLGQVESLAFAARSTTLALARPAMQAIGASEVVNAAIVVCNGILGQLMYPCALRILGIPDCRSVGDPGAAPDVEDSAITIAAGTTIGINGAAMGVSYLYERGSRAAPYAALSMTVFGVMTVVFTSVEPFNHILRDLTTI